MPKIFQKGDRVRLRGGGSCLHGHLPKGGGVYVVGAVMSLPRPEKYFVDPLFWNDPDLSFFRRITRAQAYGHPQIVFLDETKVRCDRPVFEDPEGLERCGLSGAWFEKVD